MSISSRSIRLRAASGTRARSRSNASSSAACARLAWQRRCETRLALRLTALAGNSPPRRWQSETAQWLAGTASERGDTVSQGQRFRRRALRRGYKVDEVDSFLDGVEATLAGDPMGAPVSAQEVHDVVF